MKIPNRLQLANLPTPVQQVNFQDYKFLIKRDDYTGAELSGNKVRKLEYIFFEALKQKAEYIFTCGGDQSNHARAVTAAALKFGIRPVLFLWGKEQSNSDGNLFINKFLSADIRYLTRSDYENVNDIMTQERKKFEAKGKRVYVIPEGGSTTLGIWGYINFISELAEQTDIRKIKNIYVAAGTGGTAAGLITGAAMKGLDITVSAVNVLYSRQEIFNKIINLAEGCSLEYNLNIKINPEKLLVIDGYSEEGYKNIEPSKVRIIRKFASETGIILDPAYTGKAFAAFYERVVKQHQKETLFLHTGGLFGVFGRRKDYLQI
jgi:D-cysteine desulfhydrase